jgi:hypothetical protein
MPPRISLITHYYPEFLEQLYLKTPSLGELEYSEQRRRLEGAGFGATDAYADGFGRLGCETDVVIVNADRLQRSWARQHGLTPEGNIHDQRRQIVMAQVEAFAPDVAYVFEWSPLGDAFLAEMKSCVRLLAGQIAAPLRPDRSFDAYDLMISSFPPIVDHFRRRGIASELLRLGFDERILRRLPPRPARYDVTFIGGFAPSHPDRMEWLETLLQGVNIDIFGYGVERVPGDSPIRDHHHGPVWGLRMFETLASSRITLNRHAVIQVDTDKPPDMANNMRLYEATGMGTCLITDAKSNLHEMFEPDCEVVTYRDEDECIEKIRHYLVHESQRSAIARAGQRRALSEHTYAVRMRELLAILADRLG